MRGARFFVRFSFPALPELPRSFDGPTIKSHFVQDIDRAPEKGEEGDVLEDVSGNDGEDIIVFGRCKFGAVSRLVPR